MVRTGCQLTIVSYLNDSKDTCNFGHRGRESAQLITLRDVNTNNTLLRGETTHIDYNKNGLIVCNE